MITAYGPSEVAKWLGVSRSAVSNWPERFGSWPVAPAVQIVSGDTVFSGWLPEQRAAWLAWQNRPDEYDAEPWPLNSVAEVDADQREADAQYAD